MTILALGVSYRRAPVELLELLSFAEEDLPKAYRHALGMEAIREVVILSTCNRTEVFADVASYHAGFLDLKRFLSESREIDAEEFAEPLYSHYEDDAAEHLFTVAAGLDSMVVGEPQILSQLRAAYRTSQEEGSAGPILGALFRGAVRAGRRVRTETGVGASPSAFVEAGARIASDHLGGLSDRSVLVVGAGAMASLAVAHVRRAGVGRVRVVNRNLERARTLAARAGGEAAGLDVLCSAIAQADLVITSTGAVGTIVAEELVREAIGSDLGKAGDPVRRRFFLDLAVPRDVDPAVGSLPGVALADIDDLKEAVAEREESALREIERAHAIVADEAARFAAWRRAARVAPLIRALRARGDAVIASELARASGRLAGFTDREREGVEALARAIVAKLLHDPVVTLRGSGGPGDPVARALAQAFGLDVRQ